MSYDSEPEYVALDEASEEKLVKRIAAATKTTQPPSTNAVEELTAELRQARVKQLEAELAEAKKDQAQLIEDATDEAVSHPQGFATILRGMYGKKTNPEGED